MNIKWVFIEMNTENSMCALGNMFCCAFLNTYWHAHQQFPEQRYNMDEFLAQRDKCFL